MSIDTVRTIMLYTQLENQKVIKKLRMHSKLIIIIAALPVLVKIVYIFRVSKKKTRGLC